MVYAAIVAGSLAAGIVQSVTGFGAAIFLMLILPYFFDMVTAAALSSSVTMTLSIMLAWRFRKSTQWRLCALPTAVFLLCSVTAIHLVKGLEIGLLNLLFGIFLIFVAVYSLLATHRSAASGSRAAVAACAAVSGITSGLFGIGGPLIALYFVRISQNKESYIGNTQFLFATTSIVNFAARISNGLYTVDLLPLTLFGFAGIFLGKQIGLSILEKINADVMKKVVYAYVGLSGLITVLENIH